jgi:hypothetical protein
MGRNRVRRLAAAMSLAFACAPVEADADTDCQMPRFHFVNEGVTSASIWVCRGAGCKFHFEGSSSSVFGLLGVLSSNVTLRPRNGLLGKNTIRIYAYKPKDDFVGSDEFELKIRYDKDDKTGAHETLLHVNVTVSP